MGKVSIETVSKNKIVLVRPKNDVFEKPIPLGLLHIGTMLDRAGYDVRIIDNAKQSNYKELISTDVKDALLVGITALTTEVKDALDTSDYIKGTCDTPIIWGGWHPTLFPEQTCADKSVDFVCIGEGEYTMLELARALELGSSFESINGLAYKDNGNVRINPLRGYVDMEELPPINYDLIDISKYINIRGRRTILYQSSRGCPHRCRFCINSVTENQKYRMKSVKKVVDEIVMLVEKYNVDWVRFIDDNFFVSVKRARGICEEIVRRNIKINWDAECRADYFRHDFVDENFLDLAEKSGLIFLSIGAESGSQRILNMLSKDITVAQILASAKMLSKYKNIVPSYGFIVGISGETKEEVMATIKVANRIVELCPQTTFGLNMLTAYPRCELTDDLIKQGFFSEPITLREWTADNVRALYTGRFSRKPWNENPKFLRNVSHFSNLGFRSYSGEKLIENYRKRSGWRLYRYPELLFVLIARIRVKYLFFKLPIDRVIYGLFIRLVAAPGFLLRIMKDRLHKQR